ncbi:hypothetical protein ACLB2K_045812 [Fragaria x ananassa]
MLLIDGIIELTEKMIMFKVQVRDVKSTLECLKPVIQEITEYNKVLKNQPMEEEDALQQMNLQIEEGAILVLKCSKVGAWSLSKKYKYSNQLLQLDQSLHVLLRLLELQKTRDLRETLVTVKKIETVVERIEGNVAAIVIQVMMEKMMMFKDYVRDMKLTLECLKPVISEIAEYNKVLNQPMEELQDLKSQLEDGEDLVRKCSKVSAWSLLKKYRYTNRLDQLDKSLHTVLHVLELQKTRDLRETLATVRKIETVVQRIGGNISSMSAN